MIAPPGTGTLRNPDHVSGDAQGRGPAPSALRLPLGAAWLTVLLLSLLAAAALGKTIRKAGLITTASSADSSSLKFVDAPEAASAFFRSRDRLTIRVPRRMTRQEFISIYHLENAPEAGAALERIGRRAPGDVLNEGDTVSIPLLIPEAVQ